MSRDRYDRYNSYENQFWNNPYKTIVKVFVFFLFIGALFFGVRTYCIVPNAAVGVVEKTLDPSNIINNYEWYYDAYAEIQAKTPQIHTHKKYLEDESLASEKNNLRMELTAMQQSCRSLVQRYNANSAKANRNIFKDNDLPQTLDVNQHCE